MQVEATVQSLILDAFSCLKVTEGQSFLICSRGGEISRLS